MGRLDSYTGSLKTTWACLWQKLYAWLSSAVVCLQRVFQAVTCNTKLRWLQNIVALELIRSMLMSFELMTSVPSSKLMPYQHRVSMSTFACDITLNSKMTDIQAHCHQQMMLTWQHGVEFISFASLLDSRQTCLFAYSRQVKQTCKADQSNTMLMSMLCTPTALLHVHDQACSRLYRAA